MPHSWSGIRKRLEKDLICDCLKGRVRYFITKYRKAHDDEARLAILVDSKEVLRADIFQFYKGFDPLVRMFAVMDRRVGKRTIEKLKLDMDDQPEWLRFFYALR